MRAGYAGAFTVHSSVAAVPVYERFGFKVSDERIDRNRGASVPMAYRPSSSKSSGG
ncbi:MAG: GNAT family N-acetyltransferase [Steroidobacteraceae bacterium]